MKNKFLLFIFLFFIILTWFSSSIPFFWDGTFFSKLSLAYYKNGFNNLIVPQNIDPGGVPMYSIYLALAWKLFGESLLVSHFAILPVLILIAYHYFKLAGYFLKERLVPFAMLLLLIEPCFITQSILMGYDLLMILFFLAALNALFNSKYYLFSFLLVLLCMSNLRGIMLAPSLFFIDIYLYKFKWKSVKKYLLPIVVLFAWIIYHQSYTGWFIINPIKEDTHQDFVFGVMTFKQLAYILWKINDMGRIVFWLVGIVGMFFFFKKKTLKASPIIGVVIIPLVVLMIGMMFMGNPIGHRYFIVVFVLLNILFCFVLQQIQNKKIVYSIYFLSAIFLVAGNFWIYPTKYGNNWDSSLKVLPFFELKNKMDNFILAEKISPTDVGTQFPMIANKKESDLVDIDFQYQNVWSGPISNYKYFLYSNVINTDISMQFEEVIKTWKPIKKLQSGEVEISLYENPNFILTQRSN